MSKKYQSHLQQHRQATRSHAWHTPVHSPCTVVYVGRSLKWQQSFPHPYWYSASCACCIDQQPPWSEPELLCCQCAWYHPCRMTNRIRLTHSRRINQQCTGGMAVTISSGAKIGTTSARLNNVALRGSSGQQSMLSRANMFQAFLHADGRHAPLTCEFFCFLR